MTPRTILILALACFALANIGYWHNKLTQPKAKPNLTHAAALARLEYATNSFVQIEELNALVLSPEDIQELNRIITQMAHAHRTNRVWPGVRESVNTNRFPLEDAP